MPKQKLNLALLMVDGSPIGLSYLSALLKNKITLSCIILSTQYKITDLAIETVNVRSKKTFAWEKNIAVLLQDQAIPVYYTATHNSKFTIEMLRKHKIDVAMLGGTGIIKQATIDAPKWGIVNVHPSMLPDYKGCSAVEWAIYNDDAVGATGHFLTEEIDVGDIIARGEVSVVLGDLYHDVRRKAYENQAVVLVKTLRALEHPQAKKRLIANEGGTYYKTMPPETVREVKRKLQKGLYKRYVKKN